jgi:glycerol uptake facilitator-like aquaporin
LATTSKFPWIKLAHYIPVQYLGSFVGTAAVYGIIININALNFAKRE